jgi:Mrp family chromosome partitioning ATPase
VILSVQVDGVLLVVRSGETPKAAFTRTCDLLVSVKSRMLGVVLNAVDAHAPDYYYSYRYYPYSYGYGPQEAQESTHEDFSSGTIPGIIRDTGANIRGPKGQTRASAERPG